MTHAASPNPWDEKYRTPQYRYGTEPNEFLVAHVDLLPTGRVLSLAEGEGRNAVFLAKRGFAVHAIDLSPVGLAKATVLAEREGTSITTEVADLGQVTLAPGAWNGIVSIFAHMPAEARRALHAQVVQGLAPGGVLLLEAYTGRQLQLGGVGGPSAQQRDWFMSLTELRNELAGLEMLQARELERDVFEGQFHRGRGAVVQVVARKGPRREPKIG